MVQIIEGAVTAPAPGGLAGARLWGAIETLREGFALFDQGLRLVAANDAYLSAFRAFGRAEIGLHYADFLRVATDQRIVDTDGLSASDWIAGMVARLTAGPIPARVVRLSNGHFVRLVDRWTAAGDLVALAIDVTGTMERERELRQAREDAEAAARAKSAFLASMSHEIRTPMNGVVGMAELLAATPLTDDQRLFAETIRTSGEALLTIINDVLDFSKIEAEKLRLHVEAFDLEQLIHEIVTLMAPQARQRGLTLAVDLDLFLPTMFLGDRGRVRQVLTNLVGNAVKFTRKGHVLIRVVGVEGQGGYELHMTVEDTGIGIAPDNLDRIFGAFDQVEDRANRAIEGTGLGLAISRRLVEMMGGQIWVDSELGRGSSFGIRLTLPLAESHPGGLAVRELPVRRVLIVEADPLLAQLLLRQLNAYGVDTRICSRPSEARAVVAAGFAAEAVLLAASEQEGVSQFATDILSEGRHLVVMADNLSGWRGPTPAAMLRKPVMRTELYRAMLSFGRPPGLPPEWQKGPKRKVLLADDNATNRLVFAKMVEGYEVDLIVASDGAEAISLWRKERPDLVFLDISMPVMGGRDVLALIRSEEQGDEARRSHVVALTAHDGSDGSFLADGFDAHLTKPLRQSALAAELRRVQEEHDPG